MKSIYKSFILVLASFIVTAVLNSCSEDLPNGGTPSVSYVRITDPNSSDSLVVAAGQGQMIAIIGQNFQDVRQLWFNNQRASLNPSYVTSTVIITRVPSKIPTEINNIMKMVFGNGSTLEYDFSVDISEPVISYAKSEFVNTGDVARIFGDYFYEPITVTFSGGVEGVIKKLEDQMLEVEVPAGAQPGPITITTNFGAKESNFWFRDNRNIIANFEGPFLNGWWRGGDFVVATDPTITNVNGKFMRVNKGPLGAYPYLELYGGPSDGDVASLTQVIPPEAFSTPENYSLKFEINTVASIAGAYVRLYLGPAGGGTFGDARNNTYYVWQANLDTGGEWQTVTIPWADVYAGNKQFAYSASGYGMYIYCHGPNAATYNFGMDNIRVVPN